MQLSAKKQLINCYDAIVDTILFLILVSNFMSCFTTKSQAKDKIGWLEQNDIYDLVYMPCKVVEIKFFNISAVQFSFDPN